MEFMISGRNLTVSDRFREYADEKISKIASLGDKVQRVDAKVSKETKARQTDEMLTVELTVLGRGPVIRAEASAADKFAAFDLAYNKLLERLRRAKDRKKVHHGRHTPKSVTEATATLEPASTSEPIYEEANHWLEPKEAPAEKSPYEVENDIPAGDSPVLIRRKVFPAVIPHARRRRRQHGTRGPRLLPLRGQGDQGAVRRVPPRRVDLRRDLPRPDLRARVRLRWKRRSSPTVPRMSRPPHKLVLTIQRRD